MLRIRLLGGLDVRDGDEVLALAESARVRSLLAYLLVHDEAALPRQRLAFLFWPDSSEEQARTNLRHLLHHVRHAFPGAQDCLEVTPQTLRWRPDARAWLDVAVFARLLEQARAEAGRAGELAALREAVALYRGDLLEGSYDEWLLAPRERLRQGYLGALERLSVELAARGEQAEAIAHAQRLLAEDPLQEGAYRSLMQLHLAAGDRARAVRVYHACVGALERELGVAPSAATIEAYERLVAVPAGAPRERERAERRSGPALIGREPELARLQALWRAAQGGRAQLVLLAGEAGVGKTRLVEELAEWCAHQGALVLRARAYAAEGALAYGLMIDWLRSPGLAPALGRLGRADERELARLLPELGGAGHEHTRAPAAAPSEQRRRLFEAASRALMASQQPILLVADDLQWGDLETLQFLHYLVRAEPRARLLAATTLRRELVEDPPAVGQLRAGLLGLERFTELALERLGRDATAALAAQLGGRALTPAAVDRLQADTEGNALFVVETVRAGWDETAASAPTGLAPRLQAVLRERLAQLSPPARELVGVAATIGREFSSDVAGGASDAAGDSFVAALDELWRRGIVREQGADAYDFSHDKLREVAYADLGAARRRQLHAKVAATLVRLHGAQATGVSGQIAGHLEHAGQLDEAARWYVRAAQAAQAVHACDEAVRLLERASDLLARLPEDAARIERALAVLSAIPPLVIAVEGYSSPRLHQAQERALERARAWGVEPSPVLLSTLALNRLSGRDFAGARQTATEILARAERDGDRTLIVEGHYILGVAAFWLGELAAARRHLDAAIEHHGAADSASFLARFGYDRRAVCLGRLACTLLYLGEPGEARRTGDEAVALARTFDHPYTLGLALVFRALLALELGEHDHLRHLVAELVALPPEQQPVPNLLIRDAFAGLVQVLDGQPEGLLRLERALDSVRDHDPAPGAQAFLLRLLVEAHAAARAAAAGLAATDRALATEGGARVWEAELRRLRARFLRAANGAEAEADIELARALELARAQGATLFVRRIQAEVGGMTGGSGLP